jgi:hypothetical protein
MSAGFTALGTRKKDDTNITYATVASPRTFQQSTGNSKPELETIGRLSKAGWNFLKLSDKLFQEPEAISLEKKIPVFGKSQCSARFLLKRNLDRFLTKRL